jgi:hypothetical protein
MPRVSQRTHRAENVSWLRAAALALGLVLGAATASAQNALPSNPHGTLPKGADCSDCHTATNWKTVHASTRFNHNRDTRFALTGKHVNVPCASCHLDQRFDQPKIAATQCASCHADVHRGNLLGECVRCHNTSSFRDVPALAIHARTSFPLTGAHLQVPCEGCHRTDQNGAYTAVDRDCLACHRSTLASASTIDHSGFSTNCDQCHSPFAWQGGVVFDHVTASHGFALLGTHAALRCVSCHLPGASGLRFNPPPTGVNDCYSCHQPDYLGAHGGKGYPTSCIDCHNVNNWSSSFNHSGFFNLTSGAHQNVACNVCHNVAGDFTTFSCTGCHAQAATASIHAGRTGYSYDSPSCYRCHKG